MKKVLKKNRKYLIGGRKITSLYQLKRVAGAYLRRYPFAESIRVTYCGKVKVFDLKRFPLVGKLLSMSNPFMYNLFLSLLK